MHASHLNSQVGLAVLARNLDEPDSEPWADGCQSVHATQSDIEGRTRPLIGADPSLPDSLTTFLREQGYVVETFEDKRAYSYFVERTHFSGRDQCALREEFEGAMFPCLCFGLWPHGARRGLAVTGDIDALTIREYAYRFLGR